MGRILPLPLTSRPNQCCNRSPTNHHIFSFSSLSLASGAHWSHSLPHPHPFPIRLRPHRADRLVPRPHAWMGRPGRRVGTHAELARAPVTRSRGSTRGRIPQLPLPVTLKRRRPPLAASHVAAPREATNGSAGSPSLPHAALTECYISPGASPSHKPSHFGVFPFPICRRKRKRRSGGAHVGRRRRRG
jgi:hypothetical protein